MYIHGDVCKIIKPNKLLNHKLSFLNQKKLSRLCTHKDVIMPVKMAPHD